VIGTIWSQVKRRKRELEWKRSIWVVLNSIGWSSATHRTIRCATDIPVAVQPNGLLSLKVDSLCYNSPDDPHGAPDSPVCQPANGYLTHQPEPTVNKCTRQSGATHRTVLCPQKQRVANQEIHDCCTVQCSVCTGQSGATADRRQPGPSKRSSNGS
jgi:hypothetical protein